MKDKFLHLDNENFEKTISKISKPILVDFWADWCFPCKKFSITLEDVIDEFKEKIIFAKVDIEKNQNITDKYSIRSVPTVILIDKSKIISTKIGYLSKEELTQFLNVNLKNILQSNLNC